MINLNDFQVMEEECICPDEMDSNDNSTYEVVSQDSFLSEEDCVCDDVVDLAILTL